MKVPEHGPTFPPTKEADAPAVNTAAGKCHGASGTEAASTDIIRPDAQFCPMYASCIFESLGDFATLDVAQRARGDLPVYPQKRVMGGSMLA